MPLTSFSSDLLAGKPPTMVKSIYSTTTGLLSSCVWLEKKNPSTLWTDLTLNLCLWISNGHSAHIIIPLHFSRLLSSNFTPFLLSPNTYTTLSHSTLKTSHQISLKVICYHKNRSYLPITKVTHSSVSILR